MTTAHGRTQWEPARRHAADSRADDDFGTSVVQILDELGGVATRRQLLERLTRTEIERA